MSKTIRPLSTLALSLTLSFVLPGLLAQNLECSAAFAKGSRPAKKNSATKKDFVTIDNQTMTLMNNGEWLKVSDRLSKLLSLDKRDITKLSEAQRCKRAYQQAWLSFAYMYQAKSKELDSLNESVKSENSKSPIKTKSAYGQRIAIASQIVDAMHLVGQSKYDDAQKLLMDLDKNSYNLLTSDCLYHFAQACVDGKKGLSLLACQRARMAFNCDGRFTWALRTIAFLEQKLLKDNTTAEAVLVEALGIDPRMTEAREMLVDIKLARNDFDGAIDAATRGIKLNSKSGAAHFRLGQIYSQQWRLKEAIKEFNLAIALDDKPGVAKYYRSRATAKKLSGDLPGAIIDQTSAVALSKDKSFELVELADLNLQAGNTNKSIDNLREAVTFDPENQAIREKLYKLLIAEKRYDDLASEYSEQIARHPKNASLHLGYANILLALGKDDKAVEEFKESANLSQTDPSPHRALGAYYIQKRQFVLAAREYTRALNIVPTSIKDMVALGFCYAEDDDYMKAEAAFVTAMALQQLTPGLNPDDPGRVDVMRSLACLLFDEGRYGEAATQFENLVVGFKNKGATADDAFLLAKSKLMRDLTDNSARSMLAVYEVLSPGKKEAFRYGMIEALIDAGMAQMARHELDKMPSESRADNALYGLYDSACLRLEGKIDEALAAIKKVEPLADSVKADNPSLASRIYVEEARIELAKGDADKAAKAAEQAVSTYDKSYPAYLAQAEIAAKKGEIKQATEAAHKAIMLNPYYAPAYMVAGRAQIGSTIDKEQKQGLENLKKSIELYPGWIEAHRYLLKGYQKVQMEDEAKREATLISTLEAKAKEQ